MPSKTTLALGTALASIALFCFAETGLGQDAVTVPVATSDNDDPDSGDGDSQDNKSKHRYSRNRGNMINTDNLLLTNRNKSLSIAVTNVDETSEFEGIVVTGTWFDAYPVPYPALPPVEGTRINAGKKTSFVKPQEFPTFAGNDFREVMATTPGILVSEEPQSPVINFGYRGLNSQRSETMQVLEDGVSLKNEQFGFPETHYTPILDAVERIELIRAGAALQYGCQPGGALNFVMKMPRLDAPFHFTTRNVFGSYGYYRNYTEVDGTVGPFGYYLYYDHRQQDGFREANSDYELNNGSSRFVWDVTKDSQLILTLDFYDENHGEPGGMRRREDVNPPDSVFVEDGFTQTSRFFDRFRLERYFAILDTKSFSQRGRN